MSPATVHHTEAVFSIVREIYGREHDDPMDDLDVNMAIWGEANLRYVENHLWNSVGLLFNETGKLISEQKEITGVSTLGFKDATWMSTSSLCSKAYQITNAKANVFSDSVLCVGKMGDDPIANWKTKIEWYSENNHLKDMNRIDGKPTEFEWKIFPGITTPKEQAYFENFVMGSDATEFVNKVKDQVRNRQKRLSSIAESCNEHSTIW